MMPRDPAALGPVVMAALFAASAAATAILIVLLRPLLVRYALARPNARSSHSAPTPQGAGIALVAAVAGLGALVGIGGPASGPFAVLLLAAAGLALVGAIDDIRPLPASPRLLMQAGAVAAIVVMVPPDLRIAPMVPLPLERAAVVLAGLWFVNLTNFMDGIDWMTVAQMVPVTAGVVLLGRMGIATPAATLVALLLLGALVGFAPFNRPVASVFLGDVGSLPVGLLVGWCLLDVALHGGLVAALLLPLYYLADATLTLLRRLARGDRVWEAHRTHFYQIATARGLRVGQVVGRVFLANVVLVALALASTRVGTAAGVGLLAAGAAVVAVLLRTLARGAAR